MLYCGDCQKGKVFGCSKCDTHLVKCPIDNITRDADDPCPHGEAA